jgi:hypothetical protein
MHAATLSNQTLVGRRFGSQRIAPVSLVFASILTFVGAVSAYDGYLVVRTGEDIRYFEKNPIGLCLIEYNQGNPNLFLTVKAVGTILALATLVVLYRRSHRIALPVACALMLFQAGLLVFLERA